ncbi:hypothetical protein BDP27DRAFT_1447677 [Rhodocollybia butyracea]|uniref:Uncharacterized protein n=1 Tax=Rhodocollybia butyracea TaxID=206335 RepID=A0A9P5PT21_9AGAR|nr:hypothetical protein BDP27DRAFT_1447677 [Rhodocollybia butyracea]
MTSSVQSLNVIRTLFLLGFFSVVNGQFGTSTVFGTATGTPSSTASTPLSSSSPTNAADPGVVTFYLPSPFLLGEAAVPVTTIASVSLVGSAVSNGVAYTTFIEERVIEVPPTTASADIAVGTPAPGSTTTITGTMVANSQGWTFSAPDYNNYRENCTLSGVQLECSYQFSSGVGGYGGNALAEYTLTLSTSTATASPTASGTGSSAGSGNNGSSGSGSGSSNTSSSSSKNGSNHQIGGYSMVGGLICMLSAAFLSVL